MRSVQFDWIGFTFDTMYDLQFVTDIFYDISFTEVGHGRLGYKSMLVDPENSVFLLYNGNDNMGVHVDFSSGGLMQFFRYCAVFLSNRAELADSLPPSLTEGFASNSYKLYYILSSMLAFGHFTRIDLALDDEIDPIFTPADIYNYWMNDQVITHARSYKFIQSDKGDTFYIGSRSSNIVLRIYDKGKQQNSDISWVRWEFEIKDPEYCELMIQRFGQYLNLPVLFSSYLNSYMRIAQKTNDSNKCRWPSLDKWLISIIGSIMNLVM